jgi:hypothetical protein
MSYKTQYVHLPDDKLEHIIGDGQRTECGVPIPYNSPWTTELEGTVCSKCRKASGKAQETEAAWDEIREAEILASAPPVEAPDPTPDAETVAAPAKTPAKSTAKEKK